MTRRLLLLFTILTASASLKAQQSPLSTLGRDFYFAYVRTSFDCTTVQPFQSYWILISSPYDCNAYVSYFDQYTGEEIIDRKVHIVAKNFQQVQINTGYTQYNDPSHSGQDLHLDGEVPEYTGIHVHADHPVAVSYYSIGPNDATMYLVLPTSVLGKKYVVAAAPNDDGSGGPTPARSCNNGGEPSSSYFAIVAVKDGTHVAIHPSGTTRKGTHGATSGPNNGLGTPSTLSVTLNRGQVFRVKSEISTSPAYNTIDMTGSQIESDQPVAVIAGCEDALNGTAADTGDDQRNLTCQMIVPVDYWASSGYLTMPLLDAPNLPSDDNSAGDQIKLVVGDSSGCQIIARNSSSNGNTNAQVLPYQFPPQTYNNVLDGMSFFSQCDQKFCVEQYDYRAKGTTYPLTAPTQMNVVPIQNFARSFMWTVPNDVRQQNPHRYVNVICRNDQVNKIKIYKNGLLLGPLSTIGTAKGTTTFPYYPQYTGYRFEISVGSYYATGDSAFAVYQYGMAGFDFDGDLGDFDGDDFFTEYAAPAGQTFHIDGAGQPKVTVDTICAGQPYWMVHASDTASLDRYLSSIDILKDPLGVVLKRPDADTGYTSYNVEFEPVNFTVIPGVDRTDSVKVAVQNPLLKAEAWVVVVNGAGNDTLIHLTYLPPNLKFGAGTFSGVDAYGNANLYFINAAFGVDTCSQFVLKNADASGTKALHLNDIRFKLGGQGFTAQAVDVNGNPLTLPIAMNPGDSVTIKVCFNATAGGYTLYDTLLAETDCPAAIGYVSGSTSLPEITATDYDFGPVIVGDSLCHTVRVANTGKANFTLTKQWVMTNFANPDFRFTDADTLPILIPLGKYIDLNFCFHPSETGRDSSVVTWGTDISPDRKTVKKNFSVLLGVGIKPALAWSPDDLLVKSNCDTSRTVRVYLANYGTARTYIDSVRILGPTKSEWKISATQGSINTFILGDAQLPDSIWFDITFTPDAAYNCRGFDSLVAFDEEGMKPVALLLGNLTSDVTTASPQLAMSVSPNPVRNELLVSVASARNIAVEILDLLGNRMIVARKQAANISVDLHELPAGAYFVRVQSGDSIATRRIVKE